MIMSDKALKETFIEILNDMKGGNIDFYGALQCLFQLENNLKGKKGDWHKKPLIYIEDSHLEGMELPELEVSYDPQPFDVNYPAEGVKALNIEEYERLLANDEDFAEKIDLVRSVFKLAAEYNSLMAGAKKDDRIGVNEDLNFYLTNRNGVRGSNVFELAKQLHTLGEER